MYVRKKIPVWLQASFLFFLLVVKNSPRGDCKMVRDNEVLSFRGFELSIV